MYFPLLSHDGHNTIYHTPHVVIYIYVLNRIIFVIQKVLREERWGEGDVDYRLIRTSVKEKEEEARERENELQGKKEKTKNKNRKKYKGKRE